MESSFYKDEGGNCSQYEPILFQESIDNYLNEEINFLLKSANVSRRASRKDINCQDTDDKINFNSIFKQDLKSKIFPAEWESNSHAQEQPETKGTRKKSEEFKYTCSFSSCDKRFRYNSQLKTHERSHNGEKPFKCDVCKKSFSNKGNLVVHKRIHTGEKPFKCEIEDCVKEFKTQGQLKDHIMQHYDIRPFQCAICGISYRHKSTLQCHLTVHTGQKPFACTYPGCGRKFSEKGNMKTHLQTHYKVKNSNFLDESDAEKGKKCDFVLTPSECEGFTINAEFDTENENLNNISKNINFNNNIKNISTIIHHKPKELSTSHPSEDSNSIKEEKAFKKPLLSNDAYMLSKKNKKF